MSDSAKVIRTRLRRAAGQLAGVVRMLEGERSVEDVVTQLMAVRAALDRVAVDLVAAEIEESVEELPDEQARARLTRAIRLLARLS